MELKNVAEIMRDAARQLADRFHLGGLLQSFLKPGAFLSRRISRRHVVDAGDDAAARQSRALNIQSDIAECDRLFIGRALQRRVGAGIGGSRQDAIIFQSQGGKRHFPRGAVPA